MIEIQRNKEDINLLLIHMQEYINEPNAPGYDGEYPRCWEITTDECNLLLNYINDLEQKNFDVIFDSSCLIIDNGLLQIKNKQLQNNWNELKKFVEKDIKRWEDEEKKWIEQGFMKFGGEANNKIIFKKIFNKMQELENR